MLANRVAHIGHDVYIGAGADGVWTLFDKTVSSASRPLHSVDMNGASLHPSPDQEFIAIMAPYPSMKHHVYLPESEHTLFLRTAAPVFSVVWHPACTRFLLVLTEINTVEIHDVLGASITDVIPRVQSISLVDLKNEFSGMHSKNHHHHNHNPNIHQDPSSPTLKRETTTATVATTASTVIDGSNHHHHYPHHFTHFIHLAVVEGVTGSEPLLLLLANDIQGHVFTVQLQNDGGFPIVGPKAPVPVFHCDTKKFPKSTLKNVVSPLSVQASMVDVTCGLFGIAVLRSDGCVCTGYLREKWMYHGGNHLPINQQVFQLFPPLDLTPSLNDDNLRGEPSSTLTAAPGTTSGNSTAPGGGGSKPSSTKLKPQQTTPKGGSMMTRGKSTNTWSTMSASSHVPDLTRDFMMHHHSSCLENMFLFGVRPERVESTPGTPEALGLEPEDAEISRSFALVVFPFWDEVNEGWIYDPTAATRMREASGSSPSSGGDTDPSKAFRLPMMSRNNKEPPAPLAVTLPFDVDGHNVALGTYTLCLEPIRDAPVVGSASTTAASPKLAIEDKKKGSSSNAAEKTSKTDSASGDRSSSLQEISPLFVDLNGFLMNCIIATTPWSESEPLLAAPFNHPDLKSTGGLVLGGISEFIGNIISRSYTNAELDGQLAQLSRDTNMMKDKLKKWDEDLSKKQKALIDQCDSLKRKFKNLEEQMDANNEKASWTFLAQRGLPSLDSLNRRFGEVHECLGDLEQQIQGKEDEVEKAKNEELKKQMKRASRSSKTPGSSKMTPSITPRENKMAENRETAPTK